MKILIATDGSECSRAAVKEGCRFVTDPGSDDITVMSAYEDAYAIVGEAAAFSAAFIDEFANAARLAASESARIAEEALKARFGDVKLEISELVRKGPPEHEIVEAAREADADLVIVGSHGRGFLDRLLGSVSEAVAHHAPCCVLVVRQRGKQVEG